MFIALFLFTVSLLIASAQDYEVPVATVEVFRPRGFKVSIPDEPGIKLFAFHGKLNEEFNGREAGFWARDILKAKDGRWTFYDPQAKLKKGDILYFWTTVYYNNGQNELAYYRDDQEFHVSEFINNANNNNANNKKTTPRPQSDENDEHCSKLSETTVNGKNVCKGKLIFQDEFSNFNENKWKKDTFIPSGPDYEFVIYLNSPETIGIKNNNLFIKPILATSKYGDNFINEQINLRQNCTGIPGTTDCEKRAESFQILPPILSGRLRTKDVFNFRYGIVEIRAKLPEGDWLYPELYLQSKTNDYGLDYDSGQIRVAFSPGNNVLGKELQGGFVLGTSMEARNFGIRKMHKPQGHWSQDFHIFQIKWTPAGISLSVDGEQYGHVDIPPRGFNEEAANLKTSAGLRWAEGGRDAPFDKEMYLILGVAAGGHNFPDNVQGKPWKNKSPKNVLQFWNSKDSWFQSWNENSAMLVDYVKIWAL